MIPPFGYFAIALVLIGITLALGGCAQGRNGDMGQSQGASLAQWLKAHP